MINPNNISDYRQTLEERFKKSCEKKGWIAKIDISSKSDAIDLRLENFAQNIKVDEKGAQQSIQEFIAIEFFGFVKEWPPVFRDSPQSGPNATRVLLTTVKLDIEQLVGSSEILAFLSDDAPWRPVSLPYTVNPGKTSSQVETGYIGSIKELLAGEDITYEQLRRVLRHIELTNQLSEEANEHINALTFLTGIITFLGIRLPKYNCDKAKWLKAKHSFDAIMSSPGKEHVYVPSSSIVNKALAIRQLRAFGYEIPICIGQFFPTSRDIVRFSNAMQYRFGKLGSNAVAVVLNAYQQYYEPILARYRVQPFQPVLGDVKTQVPWGYLLNVALSYFGSDIKASQQIIEKTFLDIEKLAKLFFAVLEIQPGSRFEVLFRPGLESIDTLRDAILYHQHFALEQLPIDVMREMLEGFNKHCPSLGVLEKLYVAILKWTCSKIAAGSKPCTCFLFSENELLQNLESSFLPNDILHALSNLSHDVKTLNLGYCNPMNNSQKNYFSKPFIKKGNNYYLLDANLFSKGFYHVWHNSFSASNPKDDGAIGDVFETYFLELLQKKNVEVAHGRKYTIGADVRKALGIQSQEGECDFIIEAPQTILFIEAKKKEITAQAMAGNPAKALTDMAQSFVHGVTQACLHEYCLRKKGMLSFKDGSSLQLKGRNVLKIHLSMFDRGILNDRVFIIKFLNAVLAYEYSCPQPKLLNDFQKYQNRLLKICCSSIMQSEYKNGKISMSCISLSLPQMLYLLKDVHSTESFSEAVLQTAFTSWGSQDWYQEYSCAKLLYAQNVCKT